MYIQNELVLYFMHCVSNKHDENILLVFLSLKERKYKIE